MDLRAPACYTTAHTNVNDAMPPPRPAFAILGPALLLTGGQLAAEPALDPEELQKMDGAVASAIKRKNLPGGVLWVERHGQVYRKSYGKRSTWPKEEAISLDTIFDAASLTKVAATTPCVMKLIEDGTIGLEDPVTKYLPELVGDDNKRSVTIRHLLTHTSGFLPGIRRG
ncbi:MAG: beta-lactamase family protein, partial [Akkermansiaceae bacterium]|nr:beta-lactamase family protein [Akkermansiaceae bacterium]